MTKAKVVYASLSGNTEGAANIIADELRTLGVEVDVIEISDATPPDYEGVDIAVVATYTYGDGDLPDEAVDFYEDLVDIDLSGKVYGIIGTGDSMYEQFCKSADDFDAQFTKTNATRVAEPLKIENDEYNESTITQLAQALVAAVTE